MAFKLTDVHLRFLVAAGALAVALTLFPQFKPDFVQDYAAARGWIDGRDPNDPTDELLAECCAALASDYPDMQTAHPPLATLLAIPFALLDWQAARLAWLLVSWAAIVAAWHSARVRPADCAATAIFWVLALGLGTHEPLLLLLLALAWRLDGRDQRWAGALVGVSAALKAYPALLLVGLWLSGRRRAVIVALAVIASVTLLCEVVLGLGVTRDWLAYVPINTARYVDAVGNLSLVRLVRSFAPGAESTLIALVAGGVLLLPLIPRLREGGWFAPLLPVMLLISPLSWRHYMGLTALTPLTWIEQIALFVAGVVALLIGMNVIPPDNLAPAAQGPLLLALLLLWRRMAQPKQSANDVRLS